MDVHLASSEDAEIVGALLHDFNVEFDEPTPSAEHLAQRIRELLAADAEVLLAGEVGVCVLRFQPAIWTDNLECYLAELYVRPEHRGDGIGEALLSASLERARERGADYIHLGTTEDDGGPLMFVYEREL